MIWLKRFALTILILVAGGFASAANATFAVPDFAFPKKVSKQAEIYLKKSLNAGNDLAALRALIDLSLAEGSIAADQLPQAYRQISEARQKMTDPGVVALTYLVQATILEEVYSDQRYKYDERKVPLSPLPDDWTEWSGVQFKTEINSLLDLALSDKEMLSREKIGKYVGIITIPDHAEIYYPSLLDFMACRTLGILNSISRIDHTLQADMIGRIPSADTTALKAYRNPTATKILGLYSTLLRYNKGHYAPYLNIMMECIEFIHAHVYYSQQEQAEQMCQTLMWDLYRKYFPLTEYSGDLLIDGYRFLSAFDDESEEKEMEKKRQILQLLQDFIIRYPQFWRVAMVQSKANDIVKPSVFIRLWDKAEPGMAFSANVNIANIDEAFIRVYRLNPGKNDSHLSLASTTPIAQQRVGQKGERPYSYTETVSFVLPEPGRYFIFASLSANALPNFSNYDQSNGTVINCTSLGLVSIDDAKPYIYSLNPATGQPVGNVGLKSKKNKTTLDLGKTDADGFARLSPDSSWPDYLTIQPIQGNDIYGLTTGVHITKDRPQSQGSYESVSFTDLPLYHPGDTVRWSTVVYLLTPDKSKRRPVGDFKLKAYLYNANHSRTDSLELTTDDFGRCSGQFVIPSGELTGNYHISYRASDTDRETARRCSFEIVWFTVSDYKLPTFMLDLQKPQINLPASGDATVKGRIVSYSGVGLGNTSVTLNVRSMGRFRYSYSNHMDFFCDSVKTNSDGSFTFVIPAEAMDYSPFPDGRFQCNVSATSLSGETQSGRTTFARGKSYSVTAGLTNSISNYNDFDLTKPLEIKIEVNDAEDNPVDTSVRLSVLKRDEVVFSDTLSSGASKLMLNYLQPDEYDFRFTLIDPEMKAVADSIVISNVTLFDPHGLQSPSKSGIWVCSPKSNSQLSRGAKATFYYAVPTNDSYFIYTLSSGEKVYESRWMKADAGVHQMTVSLPDGVDEAKIELMAFRNFDGNRANIFLSTKEENLQLKCESFRDKLIPGSTETWRFQTVNTAGTPERTAMIMTMFNEALNSLKSLSYKNYFRKWHFDELWGNATINSYYQAFSASIPLKKYLLYNISDQKLDTYINYPLLNTYGLDFVNNRRYLRSYHSSTNSMKSYSGGIMMKETAMANENFVDALEGQVAGLEVESVPASVMYDMEEMDEMDESVNHEVVVTRYGEPDEVSDDVFIYREETSPLAFFRPTLTTDANGELDFTFSVPNANTTWRLNAFAFTESLLSTSLTRTFVANKPIMVTPNLPRFLRAGDKADISALVMNNSDESQVVATLCELFDPLSGNVIKQYQTSDTIAAGGNCSVTIAIDAPNDQPTVGIRFKSSTDLFADGEQSLIEILPASQPVIETVPFFISPDSTRFEMSLPEIGNDARVTLEYCDNPTWYVVTALPGLRQGKISTADQAVQAIFSASIAAGLLRDYPEIDKALREWTSSDRSDSTLVSMLERNADLKTILLQATPWMVDAMTDTQRMQRLALLFNKSEIESTVSTAVEQLQRLQRNGGGWAWISSIGEPSMWVTGNALYSLGCLNRTGYLSANRQLHKMIFEALKWYETEVGKQFKKYPRQSYIDFLLIADKWSDFKPSLTSKKILANEIQLIVKKWKKYSVGAKAEAAILLAHNGYKKLSETVLQSIYEFGKQTPQQGMWWPSVGEQYGGSMTELLASAKVLLATKEITPDSPNIDPIRQWLILQKEARNWGSGAIATNVIYAILSTSPKWVQQAAPTQIAINGTPLAVDYTDSTLGYLKTDISTLAHSGSQLTVVKSDHTPAWGAVYSQSTRVMTEIGSVSCDAVSIEKRLYRQEGNNWSEADRIKVGDRVKIQLLIHANRAMQYVAVTDNRAACFEPVEQLPKPIYSQGVCFYRENRDSATNLFITNLPKGTYMLEYEMWVNNAGTFSSGIATIQSQYAPQLTAHSAGSLINVTSTK